MNRLNRLHGYHDDTYGKWRISPGENEYTLDFLMTDRGASTGPLMTITPVNLAIAPHGLWPMEHKSARPSGAVGP